jgi:sprouty-related EVH1 domain-containing protein
VDGGRRQRCADARDNVTDCISVATCACVADAVAYHCLADAEGDYDPTCSCSSSSGGGTRWMVYVLLSLLLPCLCCYWPLIGCRQCAARCGCCITHHEAARKEILDV